MTMRSGLGFSVVAVASVAFMQGGTARADAAGDGVLARMDAAMNAQLKTLDFAERKKHFDEVQAIFAEEQPMIPTVTMKAYAAARNDLANLRPPGIAEFLDALRAIRVLTPEQTGWSDQQKKDEWDAITRLAMWKHPAKAKRK